MSYHLIETFHVRLDWIQEWTKMSDKVKQKLIRDFDKEYAKIDWGKNDGVEAKNDE